MRQLCPPLAVALLLLGAASPAALAQDDDATTVMADCGAPDLSGSALDSCLERVRVLDETDPSPRLQSLEARLEQREAGRVAGVAAPPAPSEQGSYGAQGYGSGTSQIGDNPQQPASREPDGDVAPSAAQPAAPLAEPDVISQSPPPASVSPDQRGDTDAEDEPPIADPPDSDAPVDRSADAPQPGPDDPQ
ncbi:MAG: hypothetical protein ACREHV_04440 [Rhizomicrobium sp.]